MNFTSGDSLLALCQDQGMTISQIMIQREISCFGKERQEIWERMARAYDIMKNAVRESEEKTLRSVGGLIGGEAKKIHQRTKTEKPVCGGIVAKAMAYAMGVLEVNSSMGLIVAAPTAGSSGVIPGVFLAVAEEFGFSDEQMIDALFNAGAVGYLITRNATVAGAEGGCQAEVGSASAMAASAVVQLQGGSPQQCLDAASSVIGAMLGLVCDPIAGLVEAPCQKRNAMGASTALISAEMILSGVGSVVPFDEMVDAMYRVGRSIPFELRETAMGGVAATPTACELCNKIHGVR